MANLKYFSTNVYCSDSYSGDVNIHTINANIIFTHDTKYNITSVIDGTIYVEYRINHEETITISQGISRSAAKDSPFTVSIPLTIIQCDGTHNNPYVSVSVYFTGTTSPNDASGPDEIAQYSYVPFGEFHNHITLISHPSNTTQMLDLSAEIDGFMLVASCNTYFPGSVTGNIIVSIYDGNNHNTKLMDDYIMPLAGGVANIAHITLPNNWATSTIYVEMIAKNVQQQEVGTIIDCSGYWASTLPYPTQGVKIYVKRWNDVLNQYEYQIGTLYALNATNGYTVAKKLGLKENNYE